MSHQLITGPMYRFARWPIGDVPRAAAGVYTIWDSDELVYVGMSGRGRTSAQIHRAARDGKKVGLWTRLNSHASGRRSGDQFCVYVCDRLVLPELTTADISAVAAGELSLDAMTRDYIRSRLGFRFTITTDGAAALALEHDTRSGASGVSPLLNPATPPPTP